MRTCRKDLKSQALVLFLGEQVQPRDPKPIRLQGDYVWPHRARETVGGHVHTEYI